MTALKSYRAHQLNRLPSRTSDLFSAQQGRCFHCLAPMANHPADKKHPNGWTREHVMPKSAGGKDRNNIVLAHMLCNLRRGDFPLGDFEEARARIIISAVCAKRGGF